MTHGPYPCSFVSLDIPSINLVVPSDPTPHPRPRPEDPVRLPQPYPNPSPGASEDLRLTPRSPSSRQRLEGPNTNSFP